jgi:hypothetical protein
MQQQRMRSKPSDADKFTREFYEHNWRAVRDHAEETGWAVVVDENGRPIVTMNVLLEDLPPLFADEEEMRSLS